VNIPPETFAFLRALKKNNNREWFAEHKPRYEKDVKAPLLAFVEAFEPRLEKITRYFLADRSSMFRIYRDLRFSPDKTPYKTHAALQFRHEQAKDVHAPGFYLHLDTDEVFMAGGIWHPDSPTLGKIRTAIDARPKGWEAAVDGLALGGTSLKRAPRGYTEEHPMMEALKRKDFMASLQFSEAEAVKADFLDRFTAGCEELAPLLKWLTGALGLRF
jgi:uncharacterized protein (TIGR02453 family)